MFIAHLGVRLATKGVVPRASPGVLIFFPCQTLDNLREAHRSAARKMFAIGVGSLCVGEGEQGICVLSSQARLAGSSSTSTSLLASQTADFRPNLPNRRRYPVHALVKVWRCAA